MLVRIGNCRLLRLQTMPPGGLQVVLQPRTFALTVLWPCKPSKLKLRSEAPLQKWRLSYFHLPVTLSAHLLLDFVSILALLTQITSLFTMPATHNLTCDPF